jgi:hypothetical protein
MIVKSESLQTLESELAECFGQLVAAKKKIHDTLTKYADGKPLKGDEHIGWLGEIYGKLLIGGKLVDDSNEHDFESDGKRISVKARMQRDSSSSWQRTSGISKIEGDDCPTHLMFLLFDTDYNLKKVWLYPWKRIKDRFRAHIVRGQHRSYFFTVKARSDSEFVIFDATKR